MFFHDEDSAEMLNAIPKYDLLKLEGAAVKNEKNYITDCTHFEMSDRKGELVHFTEAIEVRKLRELGQAQIDRYAKQFPSLTEVEFNSENTNTKAAKNDTFEASRNDIVYQIESQSQPAPASSRAKRKLSSCLWCVRTFTGDSNFKKHINENH